MAGTVLIVDDEVQLVRHLEHLLRAEGYQVVGVHDAAEARRAISVVYPDVVLVDLKLPDADGTTLMTELLEVHPQAGYVIITAHGSIRSAVEATRLGARDYLTKPFEPDDLLVAVRNAMRDRLREEEISVLRKAGRPAYVRKPGTRAPDPEAPEFPSDAMQAALKQAKRAAATDSIVLLLGESGSGKDYLARYIHDRSRRANGPFFAINCAAVSPRPGRIRAFRPRAGCVHRCTRQKTGFVGTGRGRHALTQ